jgi:hypothetical protein
MRRAPSVAVVQVGFIGVKACEKGSITQAAQVNEGRALYVVSEQDCNEGEEEGKGQTCGMAESRGR